MEASQRWADGLELLLRLNLELQGERDLERLLERIWRQLTDVLGAERSSLFLVDEDTEELYSVIAQQERSIRFPVGTGIAGSVARTGVSLLIADVRDDARFNPDIDRRTGFVTRSMLTVPLKNRQGQVLGVAQALNRQDGAPFDAVDQMLLEALASTAGVALETVRLIEDQRQATEAVITGFVMALDLRDPHGGRHAQEVRRFSRAIAERMGLTDRDLRQVEWAGALHDVGKLATPDRILSKQGPLTEDERALYETHAVHTRRFLEAMAFSGDLEGIDRVAPYHHKWFAGGGFPPGPPEGADIPLAARIIAVGNAVAAQMSPRWGRPERSIPEALAWVRERAGSRFDPAVVDAALSSADRFEHDRAAISAGRR